MGCKVSKADLYSIDTLAHQKKPEDIRSVFARGAEKITQELLYKYIDEQREVARTLALQDKQQGYVCGILEISKISASFKSSHLYHMEVRTNGGNVRTSTAIENSNMPRWIDRFAFMLNGSGIVLKFKFFKKEIMNLLPVAVAEWSVPNTASNSIPVTIEMDEGELNFHVTFTPTGNAPDPVSRRGFVYMKELPVLDPNVPLPLLAQPDQAFTKQDDMMTKTMEAIAIDWMATGAVNVRKILPQPLIDRVDDPDSDYWFTERRLNGGCPGFIKANTKTEERPWDYDIEWDFRSSIDRAVDIKPGCDFPEYCCATFVAKDEGSEVVLTPYDIRYIVPGKPEIVQKNDGSINWKRAKALYRSFEVNTRFTYAHVGVHFNVEQYAMALYRNLSDTHPIWTLLTPHFKNVISNNRKVVRPKPDGVVTKANVYTFVGQIKLTQDRFSKISFKDVPRRVLPINTRGNKFEDAQQVMWSMLTQYVDDFFAEHPEISIDDEIQNMSKDLQQHSINKTKDCMTIDDVSDLKQLCVYVIHQAVFFHAWVHWNGFDDLTPVLRYDPANPQAPPAEEAAKLENESNMIQTFVTFMSPHLKQWPILDPELGGNARLRELLLQHAPQLNSSIQVGTLIMAPNT